MNRNSKHPREGSQMRTQITPGDDLLPDAKAATRAITIKATPEAVWPWLVQLGYGKAGWYSYDWIDNDFQPSARQIIPEFQRLEVGAPTSTSPSARCS